MLTLGLRFGQRYGKVARYDDLQRVNWADRGYNHLWTKIKQTIRDDYA